ncbi:N-acetylmuramidase domain-containing protein [Pseudomonas vancouverensis]|uniref:N-acetylmuramidase domain-containing protein n=1 Tax=Pseudomonas vancouverensis TaxID=95300 RepID=UPI003D04006F
MSLVFEQIKFLQDIRRLLEFAESNGLLAVGGELERKPEMQELYLRDGRARTMDSMHLRKCALDLNFFKQQGDDIQWVSSSLELEALGQFWEALDGRNGWGGHATPDMDIAHFERNLGAWPTRTVSDLEPALADVEVMAVSSEDRPSAVIQRAEAGTLVNLRRGCQDRTLILRLQEKLQKLQLIDSQSGEYDAKTEAAVVKFQKDNDLIVDGIVGPKTWNTLDAAIANPADSPNPANSLWLADADIADAATQWALDQDIVRAVYKVESNGRGFVDGFPKTLFEGHVFWARLQKYGIDPQRLAPGNRDILYPRWTRDFYGNAVKERDRLARAQAIHSAAALESASWGLFQIMGYHWSDLGYSGIDAFVALMKQHEREHLKAFGQFIKTKTLRKKPLVDLLRNLEWADFAYAYNGAGYRANAYDDKLEAAYRKFKG